MNTNYILRQITRCSAACDATGVVGRDVLRLSSLKVLAALLAFLSASAIKASASDPIGIYALVDKVVMEPNEAHPEKIQIWGAFALATGRGEEYAPAKRGYLYFKLNPEKPEICRKEWADLKSVAGTDQVVGFGSRYQEKGIVRKAESKVESPVVYPLGWGMSKTSKKDYKPVADLLALKQSKSTSKATPDSKKE